MVLKATVQKQSSNNHFAKSAQKQPYADVLQNRCLARFLQQENSRAGVLFNKASYNLMRKRLQHRCFPVIIVKFFEDNYF